MNARVASLNEELSDQPKNYRFFFRRCYRRVGKVLSVWGIPHKTRENANAQDYEYLI